MNFFLKSFNKSRFSSQSISLLSIHSKGLYNTSSIKLFHNFNKTVNSTFSGSLNFKLWSINKVYNYNIPLRLALFHKFQKFTLTILKKRRHKLGNPKYKMKTKNAARKRFKIVGTRYNIGFKFHSPNHRHKMFKKSRMNLKLKRRPKYVDKSDIKHLKRLLPYFKRRKFKH